MRILLADDERYGMECLLDEVRSVFPDAWIDTFQDGIPALEAVRRKKYDLVITDISMPEMNGDELARKIHECSPNTQILFETGDSESNLKQRGIQLERCLLKPVADIDIRLKVDNLHKLPPFRINTPEAASEVVKKPEKKGILARIFGRRQESVRCG